MTLNLQDIHKAYFIGVGGIGMSALARYFNSRGVAVFGYDKTATKLTKKLVDEGIKIHYQDDVDQIPEGIDIVVYTPAIPKEHKELNYFLENNFPVMKRAAVLGLISKRMRTIGVAGTHGKTTTSSILTHLLQTAKLDSTSFLGGIAQNYESNYVNGKGEWVIAEADEFDRSFLHLHPEMAIIMSMDADHLDIYGDEKSIKNSFHAFAGKVKAGGKLFLNTKLQLDKSGLEAIQILTFGIDAGDYRAENIRVKNGVFMFDFKSPVENINDIKFLLPGRHNVENATAAISIAQQLGVNAEAIKKALVSFKGIKRRFEIIYRSNDVVYIDDYAHHPTELTAAIQAARELFPTRKISGIFQPHLYSRTQDFADGFAQALDLLDEIFLMDIYPARELPIEGVSSKLIFDQLKNPNKSLVSKNNLMQQLKQANLDVLLTLGAGDVDRFVHPIKNMLADD